MRPDKSDVIGARALRPPQYPRFTAPENKPRSRGVPPQPQQVSRAPRPAPESGLDERLRRLRSQRRSSDAILIGALSVALLFALIGFAVNFLWIVSVIVMALALGFVVADSRSTRR